MSPRIDFLKRSIKYRNFILMTQRIEFFFFEKHDSQNWTNFSHVTHGIEPFFPTWLIVIEPFFFTWLKDLNPFFGIWLKELKIFHDLLSQRIELFFLNMSRKIEPFFLECDSQNWTFSMTQRIEFFFSEWQRFCWIRLQESNFFFEYVPKNRTFFENMFKELFSEYDSQNWIIFFSITYRMEHLRVWLKELNFYCNKTWHKEFEFLVKLNLTQRIEPSVLHDPKNWTFSNMT